jgi:hypothetical protein
MLRAMAAVTFVAQRCIPLWSRAHTLDEQVRAPKQSFLLELHALLRQLQIPIHMLQELALMLCVQRVLKLLLMYWPMKCLHNLRRICTTVELADHL